MKIKQAIKKAKENGYDEANALEQIGFIERGDTKALLDPEFWKALGKGMGWDKAGWDNNGEVCAYDGLDDCGMGRACRFTGFPKIQKWQYKWHKLIDYLADGGSVEDYFKQLD